MGRMLKNSAPDTLAFVFLRSCLVVSHLWGFARAVSSVSATYFAQILPWVYFLPHSGLCSNATFSRDVSLIFPHKIVPDSHLLFSISLPAFVFLHSI